MKNINKFYALLITLTFGFSLISNVGADDGGLVKNATPINISGVTEPSIATIKISKLI